MAKYVTFFSLIFLLTSCSFFSEKSKTESESSISLEAVASDESDNIMASETEESGLEDEINHQDIEYQDDGFDMTGLKELHFTELWQWEYLSEDRQWEEMRVAREPNLNYWLISRYESFEETSDMLEWVVAKPNGEYILGYTQPGKTIQNRLETQVLEFEAGNDYPDFIPTGEFKEFGKTVYGGDWESFEGEKHEVFFKAQRNPSQFYLGTVDFDMRALYHFNNLQGVIKLPINFPSGLPKNMLVLGEETEFEYKKISYRFKLIDHTSYYAYVPEE